jgi:hypothetical protein
MESQAWQHQNNRTPVRPGMYRPKSDVFLSKQQHQHVEINKADVHVFLAL